LTALDRGVLLPERVRLLHIGPPKTGTSSLQAAFHQNRAATLAQGVRYAGSARHSGSAVLAVTGRPSFVRDSGPPGMRKWETLLRHIRAAGDKRVLISSEFFADAEPPAVKRVADDIGRERLHVVVTLRPLDRIMPSQWQQYVQSSLKVGWGEWLEGTLKKPPGPTPTFWRRHRHDALVQRWMTEVGPENMTIVVIDERDHDHILRVFEQLLGLKVGTLAADEDLMNRSMTWPEIEAVRAFNIAFRDSGLGNALFHKVMHFGAAAYMKARVPPPEEPRVRLPAWARELVGDISKEMVANLRATGIRVIGDLDTLKPAVGRAAAHAGSRRVGSTDTEACITPEIAALMAVGMAVVAGHARGTRPSAPSETAEQSAELKRYATYQLSGAVLGRARRTVARAIEAAIGRSRSAERPDPPRAAPVTFEGPLLETRKAIEARFDAEGITASSDRGLRQRSMVLAGQALANLDLARDGRARTLIPKATSTCVPPEAAAWFALSVLEASDVVRSPNPGTWPRKLKPVLWPWVEPPVLAQMSSLRIARQAPRRLLGGMLRRAWRRRMPGR
jgi:nitroreductase